MRLKLPGRNLRVKIMVGTLLPLLVILALSSYLQYRRHREQMLQELERSAADSARMVESSLSRAMMTNDRLEIQRAIARIATQRGVEQLVLLNKEGEIAVSTVPQDVGKKLDIQDATCQACHADERAIEAAALVIDDKPGHRVLRSVHSIASRRPCQACHPSDEATYGVLIMDLSMANIDRQLRAEGRSTALWAFGALALLALTINLFMRGLVVRPVEHLTLAVRAIGQGDLSRRTGLKSDDEMGELARAFDRMAEGLEGKAALEREVHERSLALQAERDKLATLNTIAATVSRSLRLEEVMESALDVVLELLGMQAGWIFLCDHDGSHFRLVAVRGVSEAFAREEATRSLEGCIGRMVQQTGTGAIMGDISECPRLSPEVVRAEGLGYHVCIPLMAKGQVLGVLNVAARKGDDRRSFTEDRLQLLTAIGQQVGVAVENARLYEELQRKEALRGQLIEQLWTVQEEERRRIARELHDQTSQSLTSLLVGLKMLAETSQSPEVARQAAQLRAIAAQTLEGVHHLAVQLRPSDLDDMGLVAATEHMAKTFAGGLGLGVHFQALGMEGQRLPPAVETTIYRIVQEALTNVVKHANAANVDILLEHRGDRVVALVEDDGHGFDVDSALGRGRGRLGLFGMQERAALVGGRLTVESSENGTTVVVEIPLGQNSEGN